jgi:hypothetical protein
MIASIIIRRGGINLARDHLFLTIKKNAGSAGREKKTDTRVFVIIAKGRGLILKFTDQFDPAVRCYVIENITRGRCRQPIRSIRHERRGWWLINANDHDKRSGLMSALHRV